MCLFIPQKIKYIIVKFKGVLKSTQIHFIVYLYSEKHIKSILCNFFKKKGSTLIINMGGSSKGGLKNNFKNINKALINWFVPNNLKVKFSGKGYKLVKQSNCFNLYLNTSHTQWLFLFTMVSIRIQKQKYLFLSKNLIKLMKTILLLINVRHINIYTKRGLRLSKQKILKKIGKRST